MFPLLFLGTTCAYNENLTLSKRKTAWRSARRDCNSAASLQRVSFILRNFFLKLSDLTRAAEMPFAPAFIERVATSSHIFSQPSRMPPVICRISALFRSPDCAYFRSLYIYITFLNLKQTFVYRILNLHANNVSAYTQFTLAEQISRGEKRGTEKLHVSFEFAASMIVITHRAGCKFLSLV